MKYLNVKSIKARFNENGKQISSEGLIAMNLKLDLLIEKACKVHNGGKKRVDETVINFLRV